MNCATLTGGLLLSKRDYLRSLSGTLLPLSSMRRECMLLYYSYHIVLFSATGVRLPAVASFVVSLHLQSSLLPFFLLS